MIFVVVIVAILMSLANSWHVLLHLFINKPGEVFTGIAHYYQDYFLYASYIAQGVKGSWALAHHLYTSEPLGPFWYYWTYVLSGRIGGFLHLSAFAIYNISLLLFVAGVLAAMYLLVRSLFSSKFLVAVAFLFAATASNFFDIGAYIKNGSFGLIGDTWFSPTPALNRLGGVPHQTLQTLLIFALLLLAAPLFHKRKAPSWRMGAIILTGLIIGSTNPVQGLLLGAAMALTIRPIAASLAVLLPLGAGAVLANMELSRQEIFAIARAWELRQQATSTIWGYLISLGPILLLIPFGIKRYIPKGGPLRLALAMYGVLSVAAFISPLPGILHVASVRWLHPAAFLVFPLLAAEGFAAITQKRQKLAPVILFAYLLFTIPAIFAQIDGRASPVTNPYLSSPLNHVPRQVADAISSLYLEPDGVVLTNPTLPYDILVPPLTAHQSFTGHPLHTLNPNLKEELRRDYFAGRMSEADAKRFIIDYKIRYIITTTTSGSVVVQKSQLP